VQPTRDTQGIAAIGLVLAAFALIMSDLPAMVAAATIGLFLAYRALTFTAECNRFLGDITIIRETDRRIVRQGATVSVTSRIGAQQPDRMEITIRDLLPSFAVPGNGTAEPAYLPSSMGGWTASYPIRFMAAGETRFGGFTVTFADPFYRLKVRCTGPDCREPVIQVFPPHAATEIEGSSGAGGRRDHDYLRVVKGQTVRSFRPYQTGDDLHTIDWKMSAKHDRLYVREMSGQSGNMPCIIADLPDPRSSVDPNTFTGFSAAVGGAVEGAIRRSGGCSLTTISGADIVDSFTPIEILHHTTTLFGILRPTERHIHLYRMRDRASLISTARRLERLQQTSEAEPCQYRRALLSLCRTFPELIARSPFEAQISRVLGESGSDSVYLYTCMDGDASHIDCIAREAARKGMHVHLWTPGRHAYPYRRFRQPLRKDKPIREDS
jgi:hypothetical protein